MRRFIGQFSRFGVVGLVGLVIDFSIFNVLRSTVLAPEVVDHGPLLAKAISVGVAIVANWLGNRYWTFRAERRPHLLREGAEFAVVSLGGMVIALGCLWVSHYLLGFRSALADNISANVIGLGLGTVFRFWLYRTWVFPDSGTSASPDLDVDAGLEVDPALDPALEPDTSLEDNADPDAGLNPRLDPRLDPAPDAALDSEQVSGRPTPSSRPELQTAPPDAAPRSD